MQGMNACASGLPIQPNQMHEGPSTYLKLKPLKCREELSDRAASSQCSDAAQGAPAHYTNHSKAITSRDSGVDIIFYLDCVCVLEARIVAGTTHTSGSESRR